MLDVLNESGKSVATIGSVKVICDHNEQHMMKYIVDPANKWKSLDTQMLESYTSNSTVGNPKNPKARRYDALFNLPLLNYPQQYLFQLQRTE